MGGVIMGDEHNIQHDNFTQPAGITSADNLLIATYKIAAGDSWLYAQDNDKIVFVLKGTLNVSCKHIQSHKVYSRSMFVMAKHTSYDIGAVRDTMLSVFYLSKGIDIHDFFAPVKADKLGEAPVCIYAIPIKSIIIDFLKVTQACSDYNTKWINYYEFKFRELLFLLTKNYQADELIRLFYHTLTPDIEFTKFVLANYDKVRTLKELVDMSSYSLSAFKKRFKECFHQPPYAWMKHKRAMLVFNDIYNFSGSLKEICDKYGFSTMSQLTVFCKNNFGQTPTQIRESVMADN